MAFFPLPSGVKRALANYLKDKPTGTKIKYGFRLRVAAEVSATGRYVLENSYIKLEEDVYALGQAIGNGAFGTVKYVQSFSTNAVYVAKIQQYVSGNRRVKKIEKEVNMLYDLGLYRDVGSREGIEGTKYEGSIKHYIVMSDAGISLGKYLTTHLALSKEGRFDLAIKLCWALNNLHQGVSSRTGTAYVHRDIKPANIAISATSQVRLVDVGLCEINPDRSPPNFSGTAAYQPNIMTLLEHNVTLRNLDLIALKRVIYMPEKMLCGQGYKKDDSGLHFGFPMICSQSLLMTSGLFKYFDTSAVPDQNTMHRDNLDGNPVTLASLLVLGRYSLVNLYAQKIIKNQTLAYAVLGMYFANQGASDERLAAQMAFAIKAYVLCKVVRRYEVSAERTRCLGLLVASGITNILNQALENRVLIDLIKESSPSVRQATVLLWQNGFYDPTFLNQLKDNEPVARKVIQLVFDGDLLGVKKALLPIKKPEKQPVSVFDSPRLSLVPVLPRLPVLTAKVKLNTLSKDKLVAVHDKPPFQATRQLPAVFFAPQRENRKITTTVATAIFNPFLE